MNPAAPEGGPQGLSFKSSLGPLLILTGVFLANFTARVLLAPLLPTLEPDLGLDHSQAGSLFLYTSIGYFISLLGSGFVAARLTHRSTIIISVLALGAVQLALALADSLTFLGLALFGVGLACGLYLPCAMASIYSLVRTSDWGKAVAVHELAPNLAFLLTPILCNLLLAAFTWQQTIAVFGCLTLVLGGLFALKGKGGRTRGQAPTPGAVKVLARHPDFWIMVMVFALAIGSSLGVYTMLPLYLVTERGLDQAWANNLVSLSRIFSFATALGAGWMIDRMGVDRALRSYMLLSGLCTLGLGISPQGVLILFLFLQPMITVCLFPAAFAALARVGPMETRNLAISFVVPPAFFLGTGAIPALIGVLADAGSFGWGIAAVGAAVLAAVPIVARLKFG